MNHTATIPLIRIGTSRGIRLPKKIIEKYQFGESVEVAYNDNSITLSTSRKPRDGWEKDFARAHADGSDKSFIPEDLDNDLWNDL